MTEPAIETQDDEQVDDPGISLMPEEITRDIMRLAKSPLTTPQAVTAELGNNVLPYLRDLALVVRALVAERDDDDEGGDGLSDEDATRIENVLRYAKGVLEISLRDSTDAEQRRNLEGLLADATHGLAVMEEMLGPPEPAGQA